MVITLIAFAIVGLIAGALARLLVPGPDPMGIFATALLGMVGSFVGGTLGSLLFAGEFTIRSSFGLIGAVVGAIITLLLWRSFGGRRGARI